MKFFDFVKNLFILLIFVQVAPALFSNIRKQYNKYVSPQTQVGIIKFSSAIYDSAPYNKQLHDLFTNNDIKAILLEFECPGSAAGSGQIIHNELQQLKKQYRKPVIALVENICASGGYYIASAADHIIAPGCSIIGSIGVTLPYFLQFKDFGEQFKIHHIPMKSGTYKDATNPLVNITDADKAMLQNVLDDSHQQFIADVAHNRALSPATAAQWGDGQLFSGRQALKLGLIDEIGSAHNAIAIIKKKAIIEGEIEWVKQAPKSGLAALFGDSDSQDDQTLFHALINKIRMLCTSLFHEIAITNRSYIA
ncbi:MAG TPA: signal peptide peptidase SppA [Candidatus Babeliales bacterium]|nr:signal peptide peptidase SppA [Candidatus Babeliales bacterium]